MILVCDCVLSEIVPSEHGCSKLGAQPKKKKQATPENTEDQTPHPPPKMDQTVKIKTTAEALRIPSTRLKI
jgi:hypothetical protein